MGCVINCGAKVVTRGSIYFGVYVTDPRSRKVRENITLNPEPLNRLTPHPNLVLQGLYLAHVGRSWFQSLMPLTMVYGSGFRATSVLGVNAPNCWFH